LPSWRLEASYLMSSAYAARMRAAAAEPKMRLDLVIAKVPTSSWTETQTTAFIEEIRSFLSRYYEVGTVSVYPYYFRRYGGPIILEAYSPPDTWPDQEEIVARLDACLEHLVKALDFVHAQPPALGGRMSKEDKEALAVVLDWMLPVLVCFGAILLEISLMGWLYVCLRFAAWCGAR